MRDREKWLSLDGSDFYRKRLVEEQKEKRLEARPRVLAKLEGLSKFLKDKQFKNRHQR